MERFISRCIKKRKGYLWMAVFLVLIVAGDGLRSAPGIRSDGPKEVHARFPRLQGDYLGQKRPGMTPEVFASGIVSTSDYEHGAPAFQPDGKELYWSVFQEKEFRQRILFMRLENGYWSAPREVPFSDSRYIDGNPVFSADGGKLYFTSNRPLHGKGESRDKTLWIWVVERNKSSWSEPRPLAAPFDQIGLMAAPSFSRIGTLFFAPWQGAGLQPMDIYCSRWENGGFQAPIRLSGEINTERYEAYPFIALDESYLIFEATRTEGLGKEDLYVSFKRENGSWTRALNMGPAINSSASERFPCVTPDGRYLFFSSDRGGNHDYYWVDARVLEPLRQKSQ